MTSQDQAVLAFVKANLRAVVLTTIATIVVGFVWYNWHSSNAYGHYGCDKQPTTIGVISCHLS